MGVTCVFPISVGEGKSSQQEFDGLVKKLEFLGFEKSNNWSIDCETYHQVTTSSDGSVKSIHVLHSSEHPRLSFSVLDSSNCLVSDIGFDSVLAKLKAFYAPSVKGGKIEIKGSKYSFGDFNIKLGNITQASNFKGIVMEVHYKPCMDPSRCWNLLTEFLAMVIGDKITVPNPPQTIVDKKMGLFSAADTMLQYLELIGPSKKT